MLINNDLLESIVTFKRIPQQELYRLVVDGRYHCREKGWYNYALREKNCLPAAFNAIEFSLTNLDERTVSPTLIKEIHRRASSRIGNITYMITPGEFRKSPGGFVLSCNEGNLWLNQAGFFEIYEKANNDWLQYGSVIAEVGSNFARMINESGDNDDPRSNLVASNVPKKKLWSRIFHGNEIFFRSPNPEYLEELAKAICDQYNKSICLATTGDERLRAIATLVKDIEHLHPFHDVNGRTSTILLQRLLIQNGFLPAMLFDPNQIDGYDLNSLIMAIKSGIEITQSLIENPEFPVYAYNTSVIDNECPIYYSDEQKASIKESIMKYYASEKKLYKFILKLPKNISVANPLPIAVQNGYLDVVNELLARGCTIDKTIFKLAMKGGDAAIMRALEIKYIENYIATRGDAEAPDYINTPKLFRSFIYSKDDKLEAAQARLRELKDEAAPPLTDKQDKVLKQGRLGVPYKRR